MAIFKCKMCGGSLDVMQDMTVCECDYCGSKQTLPKFGNERKDNLYDRANHFRRNNEYEKAMGIYEQILAEEKEDAESYWSLVLCRYGIEYVEDPATHKRVPTINRVQSTSIFDDENYKCALNYADVMQKAVYESEAKAINEIQKGILEIAQKEEPFDVFICYKETDNAGRRTQDSVLANDLYHQLTQEGFKVFFSKITLEDKIGSAYEPYIYAALNSAKVMVVLGTKAEYFNAVWVKNEWSRYLALIKNGAKKVLVPAYRDMDPYDLPEEFSHLQAQDMSKLGFMQDLIRGIKKISQADMPKETTKDIVVTNGAVNIAPLLRRAFIFLEDGKWNEATEYCEKVLDQEPENSNAYLGKLMAELHVCQKEQLSECHQPFDTNDNYYKTVRFADEKLKAEMFGYIEHINTRNENERLAAQYKSAVQAMDMATTEDEYKSAAEHFAEIGTYSEAVRFAKECLHKAEIARVEALERAETVRKNAIYSTACRLKASNSICDLEQAIAKFKEIPDWNDSQKQIYACENRIEEIRAEQERHRLEKERQVEITRKEAERVARRNKKIAFITAPIICVIIAFIIVLNAVIIPTCKYNDAITLMNAGNIVEAYEVLIALDGYKDSTDKANSIYDKYKVEKIKKAKVGDYIIFGTYEQDNDKSNGKEDIEWLVLEVKDGKVLVISKYALSCQQYNESYTDVTWETCSLREWLNNIFVSTAFSAFEKKIISTVTVSADKNLSHSTNPGNATQNKVFLLSITEVNTYFNSDNARQCKPTDYAVANGACDDYSVDRNCWWWLRSPGYDQNRAAFVHNDGGVYENGDIVNGRGNAVRPALWIDPNS